MTDITSVTDYASAHLDDILASRQALQRRSGNTRVFQMPPPHLRRRAASYNPNRVPRRLLKASFKDVARSNVIPPKKKFRAGRRVPNLILRPSQRLHPCPYCVQMHRTGVATGQCTCRYRTETHIWNAKRFYMEHKGGWIIPVQSTQRGHRAAYNACAHEAALVDQSMHQSAVVRGSEEAVCRLFSRIFSAPPGRPSATSKYAKSGRSLTVELVCPSPICPVDLLWLKSGSESEVFLSFSHCARTAFDVIRSQADGCAVVSVLTNRFILAGPRALDVFHRAFVPLSSFQKSPPSAADTWLQSLPACPSFTFWPTGSALRFRIADPRLVRPLSHPLSDVRSGEHRLPGTLFNRTAMDAGVVQSQEAAAGDARILYADPPEFVSVSSRIIEVDAVDEHSETTPPSVPLLEATGGQPFYIQLPLHPAYLIDNPSETDLSAFDREAVAPGIMTQSAVDRIRERSPIVSADVEPPHGIQHPELLVYCQRSSGVLSPSSSGPDRLVITCCSGWGKVIYKRLMDAGGHTIGYCEWDNICLENGSAVFPLCWLDTPAGCQDAALTAIERCRAWQARPPAKRPSYNSTELLRSVFAYPSCDDDLFYVSMRRLTDAICGREDILRQRRQIGKQAKRDWLTSRAVASSAPDGCSTKQDRISASLTIDQALADVMNMVQSGFSPCFRILRGNSGGNDRQFIPVMVFPMSGVPTCCSQIYLPENGETYENITSQQHKLIGFVIRGGQSFLRGKGEALGLIENIGQVPSAVLLRSQASPRLIWSSVKRVSGFCFSLYALVFSCGPYGEVDKFYQFRTQFILVMLLR